MRPIDAGETSCRDPVKGLRHSISTRLMKSELQSLPQSNFQNRRSLSRESLLRSHCLQHLCRPTESGPASFEGESFDVALFRFSLSHEPFGRASFRTERMPSLITNKRRVLLCTQRAKSNLEHALNAMAEAATPKSAKASRRWISRTRTLEANLHSFLLCFTSSRELRLRQRTHLLSPDER